MKLFLAITLAVLAACASAQTALESLVTCKDKKVTFTSVVTYPAFELQNFLKVRNLTVEARAFAGTEVSGPETGSWALGGVLAVRFKDLIATGYDLGLGVFARLDNHSGGLYVSASRRF